MANTRRRGLGLLVAWLEDQPGGTWQERWVASGAEEAGDDWAQCPSAWLAGHHRLSDARLVLLTTSLAVLIGADVVRPSLGWLLGGGKKRKLARNIIPDRDPVGFAELRRACQDDPAITLAVHNHIAYRCAMVMAAKGGVLADIAVGDVAEIVEVEVDLRGRAASQSATFTMLRRVGVFDPAVPSLRELRSPPQQSVEDLVGRYAIACRPVRDLLIDYLKERQPAVDHTTLRNHASVLAGRFWADIEAHHPGIDSLALPAPVAAAWKQRLRTRSTTHAGAVAVTSERLAYLDVLSTVRAFYLDVAQWALDEPGRWARWAVPCPIKREELNRRKQVRQRKARMDARTRERLPALPALVATVEAWRTEAEQRLAVGRQAAPGDTFTVAGQTLVRVPTRHAVGANVWASDPANGKRRLLNREEDHAFWAWAVVHVLRLTGIRVEELLELSYHALVQYRLPGTGETVALLQIVPSKTDAERLLVVSPELADVLAAIIRRVRDNNGAVPSLRARDYHEHLWLASAPLLFQHRLGAERVAFTWVCQLEMAPP